MWLTISRILGLPKRQTYVSVSAILREAVFVWANRIVDLLVTATALVVVPVQIVSTLVLGCLVTVTFGLFLLPISFVWMVLFLGPLLGLSQLWDIPLLRVPAAILGIPAAVLGNAYTAMMPSIAMS